MFDAALVDDGTMRFSGRLDAAESDRARAALMPLDRPLTVDLSGLEYISSAGIAVLIEAYKRLTTAGHAFKLTNLQPRVRNVFAYAGLDRLLTIE